MSSTDAPVTKERTTKLTSVISGFDIASARCAVETTLHDSVQKNTDLLERLSKISKDRDESVMRHRMSLMTNGYRVDAAITPLLAQLGVVLARALRLVHPLDVFVIPSHEINAYCLPSRRGHRLVMCLHSGLVSRLNSQEILFVMGHEVGHAILKHADLPKVDFDNPHFSPLEVIKLRALQRASEISCDRFGLLACQDVKTACSALFKVASGLTERWISFDEAAYSRHFDEIASMSELVSFEEASRSHPLSPLRVKALIAYSNSEAFASAFGKENWTVSTDEMERTIENMLSVVAPDLSELDGKDEAEATSRFLFDSALLMIGADGLVSPDEVAWLQQRISPELTAEKLEEDVLNPAFRKELIQQIQENSRILVTKLPQISRAHLLRIVCDIAVRAGGFVESEFEVLNMLRDCLDVPIEIAKRVLSMAEKEFDGDEGDSEPGDSEPGDSEPGDSEPGDSEPGDSEPGDSEPGDSEPGDGGQESKKSNETTSTAVEAAPCAPLSDGTVEAILANAKLPDKAMVEAGAFAEQLKASRASFLFSVRAIVSWAIRSSGRNGIVSDAQAKRIALAAIEVCCSLQDQRKISRRARATSLDKLVRKYGTIALFSRNETVFLGLDDIPHAVLSISRVNGTLVIAPADDLQATIEVSPHKLRKDPVQGDWPDELSNV
jgi:uncharacterized tellurite resistance protein B-like protein